MFLDDFAREGRRVCKTFCTGGEVRIKEFERVRGSVGTGTKPEFGDVIGVSLLIPAKNTPRKHDGQKWEQRAVLLKPLPIYVGIRRVGGARTWYGASHGLRYLIISDAGNRSITYGLNLTTDCLRSRLRGLGTSRDSRSLLTHTRNPS
jgi:hypothetical protein